MLKAISPIDGRYASKTQEFQEYFSEWALIKYRVEVEVKYFLQLAKSEVDISLSNDDIQAFEKIWKDFSLEDAQRIKDIESVTNHDVKAVEYFIKDKMKSLGLEEWNEFIHFALTSQDINNTCLPLQLSRATSEIYLPALENVIAMINQSSKDWWHIPMLARTHGQPASPTTLGKEIQVFVERLNNQMNKLKSIELEAKFGGATGQFNAHVAAYPKIDWPQFADQFIASLNLKRSRWTTQIGHYDDHAELFDAIARINTILTDLCRDIWTYISINYFKQKTIANEVGSSAMPHKVNPIDFENAEGNLGIANAFFQYFSAKLPISRMQRDLTDSTVTRNTGVPFSHSLIALKSIAKGWNKLQLNEKMLNQDLEDNWAVVAEAIQNIMRREKYPKPYEALKALTRGKSAITKDVIHEFIEQLNLSDAVKAEMLKITPQNYIGILNSDTV